MLPTRFGLKLNIIYANEADVLNMALFGKTAKDWRDKNPKKDGNIRDYSTVEQSSATQQ